MFLSRKYPKRSKNFNKELVGCKTYPTNCVPVEWREISPNSGNLPSDAFEACRLETGEIAYVARSHLHYILVTGFTTKNSSEAYIPYGCAEQRMRNYEVLVTNQPASLYWMQKRNGEVPSNGVLGGLDYGEKQYIGRTCCALTEGRTWDGLPLVPSRLANDGSRLGKIHPSHRCLYIPYNGKEYIFPSYEVLCHKQNPGSLYEISRWKILKVLYENNMEKKDIKRLPLSDALKQDLESYNEAP